MHPLEWTQRDPPPPTHGGPRPNAGRKPGPKTKVVSFRVRAELVPVIREQVKIIIKNLTT